MPINYKDYPKNWKWLSKQIRQRANNKCELCFAPNNTEVFRPYNTKWKRSWYVKLSGWGDIGPSPKAMRKTKVVLTVHHINGNLKDNRELNLIALCQKCHLRLDIAEKLRKRSVRK